MTLPPTIHGAAVAGSSPWTMSQTYRQAFQPAQEVPQDSPYHYWYAQQAVSPNQQVQQVQQIQALQQPVQPVQPLHQPQLAGRGASTTQTSTVTTPTLTSNTPQYTRATSTSDTNNIELVAKRLSAQQLSTLQQTSQLSMRLPPPQSPAAAMSTTPATAGTPIAIATSPVDSSTVRYLKSAKRKCELLPPPVQYPTGSGAPTKRLRTSGPGPAQLPYPSHSTYHHHYGHNHGHHYYYPAGRRSPVYPNPQTSLQMAQLQSQMQMQVQQVQVPQFQQQSLSQCRSHSQSQSQSQSQCQSQTQPMQLPLQHIPQMTPISSTQAPSPANSTSSPLSRIRQSRSYIDDFEFTENREEREELRKEIVDVHYKRFYQKPVDISANSTGSGDDYSDHRSASSNRSVRSSLRSVFSGP